MRVDLQKVLFVGPASKQEAFLSAFQKAGIVQFIGTKVSLADLLANEFQDVVQAIKILRQFEVEQTPAVEIVNPVEFSQQVIDDKEKLNARKATLKEVLESINLIAPFGPLPFDLISSIESETSIRFRLWIAPIKREAAKLSPHLIYVSEDAHRQYFVSLTPEDFSLSGLEPIPLTSEMAQLSKTAAALRAEIAEIEEGLKRRAPLVESLRISLFKRLNDTKRERAGACAKTVLDNRLFSMTGWVPTTELQKALDLATSLDIFTDVLPTLPDEVPPTHLENGRLGKIGEDLVNIYDTPSHTDTDPSPWVLAFFALFFAMIVGDAGYGLLFLITALLLRKKASSGSGGLKRFVVLVGILGASCIVWGLLTNSFFAIEFSPTNPLRAYSPLTYLAEKQAQYHIDTKDAVFQRFLDIHDGAEPSSVQELLYHSPSAGVEPFYRGIADGIMLELALIVGCIHILLSVFRYVFRNIANAGWILCIVGGYLYFADFLHAPSVIYYLFHLDPAFSASVGLQLLICGLIFTFTVSIIKNGIADLFLVALAAVSVFADILSYLRLYALGLSGSIVSGMINGLADSFPFVIAAILIVLSHSVNILMSVVGGVIHGLRLNFLEWYHYSFDGGGKPFNPLCIERYH
jgi:V/A-type H+-transporting ATPase subunit I